MAVEQVITALDTFNMGTANVTLYAQWMENENPAHTPPTYTPAVTSVTVTPATATVL